MTKRGGPRCSGKYSDEAYSGAVADWHRDPGDSPMKDFGKLTYLGQVRALRPLAEEAAVRFGLSEARLTLIQHGENATYRVDTLEPVLDGPSETTYKQGRYL